MNDGFSAVSLTDNYLKSPEYSLKFGAPDNAGFVTMMYRYFPGWEPEPPEVAWQAGALSTVSRAALAQVFLSSPEFRINNSGRLLVSLLYFTLLMRDPGPEERASLAAALNGGASLNSVVESLVNSP